MKDKLEVGMYVRGKYYQHRGKIGKIIKNYNNDLEIAYKDFILKTNVSNFIDDNYDINGKQYKASYNIIDVLEEGDYVNGNKVIEIEKNYKFIDGTIRDILWTDTKMQKAIWDETIKSIVTHEQMEQMAYKVVE